MKEETIKESVKLVKEGAELVVNKLEILAREMGTTVEYLWGVLIKQAYVTGITNIAILLMLAIIAPFWFKFAKHVYKLTTEESWDCDIMIPVYVFSGIYVIAVIITSLILVPEIVTCFINSEYFALNKVLNYIN